MALSRSILITGCSSGIGYFCAHGLRARGWRVFATARKDSDIARLEGEGLEVCYLDYTDSSSIAACVDWVSGLTGGVLDALFNNGAYGQPGAVEDLTVGALRAQFEANFFGWHDLTVRCLPLLMKNGGGRIVQNSSVLGLIALKWRGAYNSSKFALEGLTDTMRLELRDTGIFVSTIEPGPITSKFRENAVLKFFEHIDMSSSRHRSLYERHLGISLADAKLSSSHSRGNFFLLPPDAVLKKLVHALESGRPKPRYYVTGATHIMAFFRRILPSRILDFLLASNSGNP